MVYVQFKSHLFILCSFLPLNLKVLALYLDLGSLLLYLYYRFMFAMSKAGGVIPTYEFVQVETEAIDFLTTNFSEMESSTVWMMLEIIFYIYFFRDHLLSVV